MSNYRRLISYIYAYEGGIKGKNIGFAKLEARSGQCKISVNVKKVYVGSSDMGVYLLAANEEIFLGKIFIRNGAGEFRAAVQVMNVENSGYAMERCYGLTIHSVEDTWRAYTTIWEDAGVPQIGETQGNREEMITHAAEIQPQQVSAEETGKQESDVVERSAQIELGDVTSEMLEAEEMKTLPQTTITDDKEPDTGTPHRYSIVEKIEAEIQAQAQAEKQEFQRETAFQTMVQPAPQVSKPLQAPEQIHTTEQVGNTQELERLEREEQEENQSGRLWKHFRKSYPKIQAFDYTGDCEILTVKPQDIGLLPRETWNLGNNSFLLHGYYNYRYLILAKLQSPHGGCRYLIGVPGHYYSNEKYMASMFGFPNFVLAKMQPAGDGRFGYWYTDIKLGSP